MNNLTSHMTVHSKYIDAGLFFLCVSDICLLCIYMPAIDRSLSGCRYVGVAAHLLACLFYMIPVLSSCEAEHQQVDGVCVYIQIKILQSKIKILPSKNDDLGRPGGTLTTHACPLHGVPTPIMKYRKYI